MPTIVQPAITERFIVWGQQRALASVITGAGISVAQSSGTLSPGATSGLVPQFFYIDASVSTPRPTKLRLLSSIISNDTASAITFTVGLYPVGTPSGGVAFINPNVGTVLAGSTITYATPAANLPGTTETSSGDFAYPAAGSYILGVNASGAMAANSVVVFGLRLENRFV